MYNVLDKVWSWNDRTAIIKKRLKHVLTTLLVGVVIPFISTDDTLQMYEIDMIWHGLDTAENS